MVLPDVEFSGTVSVTFPFEAAGAIVVPQVKETSSVFPASADAALFGLTPSYTARIALAPASAMMASPMRVRAPTLS
jgi:hypothetical protein